MTKTKNNPEKYKRREVTAPKGRPSRVVALDFSSPFFTKPVHAGYLDWRSLPKPTKRP